MSDLPLTSSPSSSPAAAWLELDAAAALSGKSVGHLRRLCGDRWMSEGKARLLQEQGIKPRWQVRADADDAFTPSTLSIQPAISAAVVEGLRAIPAAARTKAQEKARILAEWDQSLTAGTKLGMNRDQATAIFLQRMDHAGTKVSRTQLYEWQREAKSEGLLGLVDGRSAKNPVVKSDDPFLAEILRYWLCQGKRKFTTCYEMALLAAQQKGWTITGERNARRHVDAYAREKPALVLLLRFGEKAFEDNAMPFTDRDYSALAANDIWNADHHEFDVMVKVGERLNPKTGEIESIHRRPWLTAWQDLASRKIVGWVIRAADPNTDVILDAFRRACLSHGVPVRAYTDNGKDFDSYAFTGLTKAERWQRRKVKVSHDLEQLGGIYAALGINHMHALPFHGQSKPIERWFRTVEDSFGRSFETYCGSSPAERPEDLYDFRGRPGKLSRGLAPTLEEFTAGFTEWLEVGYHQRIHTGDAMDCTPAFAWENKLQTKRTTTTEVLDLLIRRRLERKVGQNGVDYKGLWYGQGALSRYLGQTVFIRIDERDSSKVTVWTPDDKFICDAPCNRRLPPNASMAAVAEAQAIKARQRKDLRAGQQARLRIAEDIPDTMRRAAAARNQAAASPTSPIDPPSIAPIRTDLESHLTNDRPAFNPYKKAVGDDTPAPGGFRYASENSQDTDETFPRIGFCYSRTPSAGDES